MAERIIFTCDRCQKDFEDLEKGKTIAHQSQLPGQWSCTQQFGITRFILCEPCTEELHVFLGIPLPKPPTDPDVIAFSDSPTAS